MPKDFLQGASLKPTFIQHFKCGELHIFHIRFKRIASSRLSSQLCQRRVVYTSAGFVLATNVPLKSMGMEYPAGSTSRTGRSSTSTRSMQSTSRRRRLMETRRVRTRGRGCGRVGNCARYLFYFSIISMHLNLNFVKQF